MEFLFFYIVFYLVIAGMIGAMFDDFLYYTFFWYYMLNETKRGIISFSIGLIISTIIYLIILT